MKSINNEKLKSREKSWDTSRKSGIVTKTLVALSTVFVLWQQPAKANFNGINTNNTINNVIMVNTIVLAIILDDDKPKSPEAKKVIKEIKKILSEFNINDKLALKDFLGLLSKFHKKEIKTIEFIDLFMKLWEKYKLSSDNTMKLLNKFVENNYMPENFSSDLNKYMDSGFRDFYDFYGDKTDEKINALIKIYKKTGTISQQDLEKIIPDLLEANEKKNIYFVIFMLISLISMLLVWAWMDN